MSELYQSILHSPGTENMGGFRGAVVFFPAHHMKTVPTLVKEPSSPEDLALAEGAFEFKDSSKKPIVIYSTRNTTGMKADNQGEADGQSFKVTGEFFHPGVKTEAAAFARLVNNTPGYLIVTSPEGEQFIVGQPGLPCTIKPSFNGGTAPADRRGFPFTFEADSYCPFIKLKSPIDFETDMP